MARDGSSGGCIRMCVITKDKVERHFVAGNELPRFWEGREVVPGKAPVQVQAQAGQVGVAGVVA
jgi:20S proteasome subunit beta 1